MPPVAPMLSKSVAHIPEGASYEPKWDGFQINMFSRRRRGGVRQPQRKASDALLPELVAAAKAELPPRCVIDGEIIIAADGQLELRGAAAARPPADSGSACLPPPHRPPSSQHIVRAVNDQALATVYWNRASSERRTRGFCRAAAPVRRPEATMG